MNSIDDLYAAIGVGAVAPSTIVLKIKEMHSRNTRSDVSDWRAIQEQLNKSNSKLHKVKAKSPG